ncbi:hypothetical protein JN11_00682 [Mucilaginibacter frigoritolerans]|uniref:Uncharacterized protein n=1 Tax=Mucilaginibacter frigoritolerans TaxID=652788 RepID=A0A562UGM6_9SPHI|nr:hypothetical protein [Mucilaginibacter frigoritolerans]TWJ04958.1 hypothetical protein JN11_00682 [Mucilaginibacter frigoritolerans]
MNNTSTKISALSNQIKAHCHSNRHFPNYVDPTIMGDDLRYNLSPVLTDLLIALKSPSLTRQAIEVIISQQNQANGTNFSFQLFFDKGWIRQINGRYAIPSAVRTHIWKLADPAKFNRYNHPIELEDETRCMVPVEAALSQNDKTSIARTELEAIIGLHNLSLTPEILLEKGIVALNVEGRYYLNRHQHYTGQLKNRIAALAWHRLVVDPENIDDFRIYLSFLAMLENTPDKLPDYLPYDTIKKIRQLAEHLLITEADLSNDRIEIRNDRLDADNFRHEKITDPIADIDFNLTDSFLFTKQLEHYRDYDHDMLFHHNSRRVYHMLLHFLFLFDQDQNRFQGTLRFFKESKSPYIKAQLLWLAEHTYPEILPYFIGDLELAPIGFDTIRKLKIDEKWLQPEAGFQVNAPITDEMVNKLWDSALDIFVEAALSTRRSEDYARPFAFILSDLARLVFSFNTLSYERSVTQHQQNKVRYNRVLKLLQESRVLMANHYPTPPVRPLLVACLLPGLVKGIAEYPQYPFRNELIVVPSDRADLLIEVLRLSQLDFGDVARYGIDKDNLELAELELTQAIWDLLAEYFTVNEVDVEQVHGNVVKKTVKRVALNFGIEKLDLAFVFANFQKNDLLDDFIEKFNGCLNFNKQSDSRNAINKEQAQKVAVFMKLVLVGFIGLSQRKEEREFVVLPITETLERLEQLITALAVHYNTDDLKEGRVNVFSELQYFFSRDLYSQELDILLYQALNYFEPEPARILISQFFDGSQNLQKMLSAYNRISDKKIKGLLADAIKGIAPKDFIKSAFTMFELESALIEIANSRNLFSLAGPFVKAIEDHLEKRKIKTLDKIIFLYRIKLLLALKNKQSDVIATLDVPKSQGYPGHPIADEQARKQFYLGLDQFYNLGDLDGAIRTFERLNSQNPQHVEYAVYLYQARTFRDLATGDRGNAQLEWEAFTAALTDKSALTQYSGIAQAMDLLYYIWTDKRIKFDQTLNILAPAYLYQDELILPVYNYLMDRGLVEAGFHYLGEAINYLQDNGTILSEDLKSAKLNAINDELIGKIRHALGELRNLPPEAIPRVIPQILNGKNLLNEFILAEIVESLKVMREKIKAVESIVHEDHFNDVFVATLRRRFPLLGWEITDQPRTGASESGTDAGEADIVVRAGGTDIALLEALKMNGGNYPNLCKHIKKCIEYIRDLDFYYIIVYYHGNRSGYKSFQETYRDDIAKIDFPTEWAYHAKPGFEDMTRKFASASNLYVASTKHGDSQRKIYHVLLDLSKAAPVAPKTVAVKKRKGSQRLYKHPF